MGIDEVIGDKREDVLRIAHKHGVQTVRVFGSVARGDARPDSDIDLLVEAGEEVPPWFPGGLIAELEQLLGRHVDVGEPHLLHPLIREQVLAEAVPL